MTIADIYEVYKHHPSVETDTRKLKKGDLFFALKGPNFNGNLFAKTAIEKGAAYAVIDEETYSIPGKTILVKDVLEALQQLALHHRKQFNIPFVAITGSNGKTTTKELVHAVLSTRFKTYTTEGNLNNHIGIPLTLLKIKPDAEMAVIEMGANHQGEIASYCRVALPSHGLITNCGKAHLEGFGGEAGVRKGKGELFDFLRTRGGKAFIMSDYNYLVEMSKGIQEVITYGTRDADVTGTATESKTLMKVTFEKGLQGSVQTQLVGNYNLPNVLAAAAVGTFFGVTESGITKALEAYTPSNSRSQLVKRNSNTIILDAYNANPSSMKAAIENFAESAYDNKILVLGAMAELGEETRDEHKKLLCIIDNHRWKEVLLVGGEFLKMETTHKVFSTATEAGEWLKKSSLGNASLLIKGSRSMKMEKVLEYV